MKTQPSLVSACGLYCGACYRYKKGKCPGCAENHAAAWCKIRSCMKKKSISTCAECNEYEDVYDCSKFNTLFSKFFYYFFKSDRKASLQRIAVIGIPAYAEEMHRAEMTVIRRK